MSRVFFTHARVLIAAALISGAMAMQSCVHPHPAETELRSGSPATETELRSGSRSPASKPSPDPSSTPKVSKRPVLYEQARDEVHSWPGQLWRLLTTQLDGAGLQVTNSIFNSLTQFDLVKTPIGKGQFQLTTKREVFDNYDLLNTWTVIDHFYMTSSIPILNASLPVPTGPAGTLTFGFWIGGNAGMTWTNIRQVPAQRYRELPSVNDEQRKIELSTWFKEQQTIDAAGTHQGRDAGRIVVADPTVPKVSPSTSPIPTDPNVTPLDPSSPWYMFDPSIRPRLSKLLNRITFPFRLPVSYEKFKEMESGELISYSGTGGIEVGGSVGWTFIKVPYLEQFNTSISVKTYVHGDYTISVLKETERFAKVKVSRSLTRGAGFGFNSDFKDKTVFDGVVLLKSIYPFTVGKYNFHLLPFNFSADKNETNFFDVGYRFDLDDPAAQEAFGRAVLGSFALSEELRDRRNAEGLPIVERIFDRAAESHQHSNNRGLTIGGLFNWQSGHNVEEFKATLNLPDGTNHVLKEATQNSSQWKNIFGIWERFRFNFTTALNQEAYEKGDPNAFFMVVEAFIDDSRTTGKEIRNYIAEVERVTGKTELLPELPLFVPKKKQPKPKPSAKPRHSKLGEATRRRLGDKDLEFTPLPTDDDDDDDDEDEETIQDDSAGVHGVAGVTGVTSGTGGTLGSAAGNDPRRPRQVSPSDEEDPVPANDGVHVRMKRAMYGRSSFYYGLNIPRPLLEKFISTPDNQKIALLEMAFGVTEGAWERVKRRPEYFENPDEDQKRDTPPLLVQRFYHRWKRIHLGLPVEEQVHRLGELFSERRHSYELMLLLQLALAGEELDYFVTAQNAAFGRVQQRGKATTNVDKILYQADQQMGFERMAGGFRGDPEATMTDVNSKVLDDDRVELRFNLTKEAKFVYFRVTRSTRWKRYKVVSEVIFANNGGRFPKGKNTIVLDRLSTDYLSRELGTPLQKNEFYIINLGYTRDGVRWGQATSTRFQMLPPPPPVTPLKLQLRAAPIKGR